MHLLLYIYIYIQGQSLVVLRWPCAVDRMLKIHLLLTATALILDWLPHMSCCPQMEHMHDKTPWRWSVSWTNSVSVKFWSRWNGDESGNSAAWLTPWSAHPTTLLLRCFCDQVLIVEFCIFSPFHVCRYRVVKFQVFFCFCFSLVFSTPSYIALRCFCVPVLTVKCDIYSLFYAYWFRVVEFQMFFLCLFCLFH